MGWRMHSVHYREAMLVRLSEYLVLNFFSLICFREQTLAKFKPKFVAIHFQECGGKTSGQGALEKVEHFARSVNYFVSLYSHTRCVYSGICVVK